MKNINLKTQGHVNYVIAFSDGGVKVGVTSRPQYRIAELRRARKLTAVPVLCMLTPPTGRGTAFKTEKDICGLMRNRRTDGTREWFSSTDVEDEFQYLAQTTGMFWIQNNGSAYQPTQVAV